MQVNADYSKHHQTTVNVPLDGLLRILQEATNDLPKGVPAQVYYSSVTNRLELTWDSDEHHPSPF